MALHAAGTDIINRVVAAEHTVPVIQTEVLLILRTIEIVQNPQAFCCIQRLALYLHCIKRTLQLCGLAVEVHSGFLFIAFVYSDREILFLHTAVRVITAIYEHSIIVLTKRQKNPRFLRNTQSLAELTPINVCAAGCNLI